jgi:hypothetical protein
MYLSRSISEFRVMVENAVSFLLFFLDGLRTWGVLDLRVIGDAGEEGAHEVVCVDAEGLEVLVLPH